ncbi:MAG: metal-dependent hydrolase [Burkholderiales bacterium]|jgi:ABC-2 type transport system permease protein|nr:metal-dependent hydrolase [Burkholderiales bacterium]
MLPFIELVKKEIYRFMSIWVQTIFGPVTTAVLYQLIFGEKLSLISTGIPGVAYATFLIPGLIMMQVLLNAFGNGSSSLIQSKYTGNIIFILMAPISPLAIYMAFLVSSIVRGIVVGVAVTIGIAAFGIALPKAIFALLYFLIFGAAITGGLGLIAGILSEKFDQLAGFQSFVIVPLIYLAGIFFNPHSFSGIWQVLAMLDPFLYIVDGFRYGFIAHADYNIGFGAFFVGVCAISVNLVGYWLIKRGIRIKK